MDNEERAAYLAALCEALEAAGVSMGELARTVRMGLAGSVAGPERLAELCGGLHAVIAEVARAAEEAHGIDAWLGCLRACGDEKGGEVRPGWTVEAVVRQEATEDAPEPGGRFRRPWKERQPGDEGIGAFPVEDMKAGVEADQPRPVSARGGGLTEPMPRSERRAFGLMSRSEDGEWSLAAVTLRPEASESRFWRDAPSSWRPFELDAVPWAIVRFPREAVRLQFDDSPGGADLGVWLPGQEASDRLVGDIVDVQVMGVAGLEQHLRDWLGLDSAPVDAEPEYEEPCPECGYDEVPIGHGGPCPNCGESEGVG